MISALAASTDSGLVTMITFLLGRITETEDFMSWTARGPLDSSFSTNRQFSQLQETRLSLPIK